MSSTFLARDVLGFDVAPVAAAVAAAAALTRSVISRLVFCKANEDILFRTREQERGEHNKKIND